MLVKFRMSTQSYKRGSVVELQEDESLRSLLERGIVEPVELEVKPDPAVLEIKPEPPLETKAPKRGRPRKATQNE